MPCNKSTSAASWHSGLHHRFSVLFAHCLFRLSFALLSFRNWDLNSGEGSHLSLSHEPNPDFGDKFNHDEGQAEGQGIFVTMQGLPQRSAWMVIQTAFPLTLPAPCLAPPHSAQSREPRPGPGGHLEKKGPQGPFCPRLCKHGALVFACPHFTPSWEPIHLQHYSSCPLSWSHTHLLLGKEQGPFQTSMSSSSDTIQCSEPFHYMCLVSLKPAPLISQVGIFFHTAKAHFKMLSAK